MHRVASTLINTPEIELWPAHLLSARGNRDARAVAQAGTVLRRKRDGAYLAADLPAGILPLIPRLMHEPGIDDALDALEQARSTSTRRIADDSQELPLQGLHARLDAYGIAIDAYRARTGLIEIAEPCALTFAGRDRYCRPLWLRANAARAWGQMTRLARGDGIQLEAISGYRSHAYQAAIVDRKLARGDALASILRVNAAPGFSEHHSGRALDIGTPGEPPAEESFESTDAFRWLRDSAGACGFTMSYPRDNPHGIVHEPWHWAYRSS